MKPTKSFCRSQINLPFPYPMLDGDAKTVRWPFKTEGFAQIIGRISPDERLVHVTDLPAIITLTKQGFFGIQSSKEILSVPFRNKSDQSAGKPRFVSGFYSLEPVELTPAFHNFPNDVNKIETTSSESLDDEKVPESNFPVFSSLKLCPEEAYFLAYVFGVLAIVKDPSETGYYNLEELWIRFCEISEDSLMFAARFAAYYYFRSKGYVVRNGFKFGVDYLLYEEGPPFNHSIYSVIVDYNREDGQSSQRLKFREIAALTRVSKNSCKELILCTVAIPGDPVMVTKTPGIIKYFKISLIAVNRQNPTTGSGKPPDIECQKPSTSK